MSYWVLPTAESPSDAWIVGTRKVLLIMQVSKFHHLNEMRGSRASL